MILFSILFIYVVYQYIWWIINNTTAKKLINTNKYGLSWSFQQVLYRTDNWINEGSASTVEYIDGEYINVSIYNPLSGSTYIELPNELKNSKRDWLILKTMIINVFLVPYKIFKSIK